MLSVVMLSKFILSLVMISAVMLGVVTLSVVMLGVVMLNVNRLSAVTYDKHCSLLFFQVLLYAFYTAIYLCILTARTDPLATKHLAFISKE
jgi:hypothetical protein